jgi:peroxiredoxin
VVAISADSLESHQRFVEKLGGVPFPLASDASAQVARLYGVASDDGRRASRAVFVIEKDGTVLHANRQYNPGNTRQYLALFEVLGLKVE